MSKWPVKVYELYCTNVGILEQQNFTIVVWLGTPLIRNSVRACDRDFKFCVIFLMKRWDLNCLGCLIHDRNKQLALHLLNKEKYCTCGFNFNKHKKIGFFNFTPTQTS